MAGERPMTNSRHVMTVDDFLPNADEMRRYFEERLGDLGSMRKGRFVWDYWHVPNQYTYIRTFAREFFPTDVYRGFMDRLLGWGRETLGCTKVFDPWLSYYIDGCRQELHSDLHHGPWAYVFSLTKWDERSYTGGETLLLNHDTLDFWHQYRPARFSELPSFAELIEPRFNRLTVFDPRIPHAVRQVEGTRDPLDSRIAVHSWFYEPALTVSEAIEEAEQRPVFEATLAMLLLSLRDVEGLNGQVTARVDVNRKGKVTGTRIVSSSLVATSGDGSVERVERTIEEFLASSTFPPPPNDAWAVLPVSLPVEQDWGDRAS
jgi:2OG-Fe(II) oxygenase superfamily